MSANTPGGWGEVCGSREEAKGEEESASPTSSARIVLPCVLHIGVLHNSLKEKSFHSLKKA